MRKRQANDVIRQSDSRNHVPRSSNWNGFYNRRPVRYEHVSPENVALPIPNFPERGDLYSMKVSWRIIVDIRYWLSVICSKSNSKRVLKLPFVCRSLKLGVVQIEQRGWTNCSGLGISFSFQILLEYDIAEDLLQCATGQYSVRIILNHSLQQSRNCKPEELRCALLFREN